MIDASVLADIEPTPFEVIEGVIEDLSLGGSGGSLPPEMADGPSKRKVGSGVEKILTPKRVKG